MHWFQGAWPPWWRDRKAAVWGPQSQGRVIRYRCDSVAIVHVIHTNRSTEPLVMQLLRDLNLFAMEHAFYYSALHIAGTDNGPADSLSHNRAALFCSQVPQAPPIPDTLHPTLLQLFLAEHAPNWLSSSWRQQLTTILGKVLQNPHNAPITLSAEILIKFCQYTNPASEHQIMLFCTYLALQGLKWQIIKSYLSAVHHFQLMQGAPPGSLDEAQPHLQLILRGIKRATSTKPSKARLPITPFILRQMWRAANENAPSQDT